VLLASNHMFPTGPIEHACIRAVKEVGHDGPWVLCMYGNAFPEMTLRTAVRFLQERHPDILAK